MLPTSLDVRLRDAQPPRAIMGIMAVTLAVQAVALCMDAIGGSYARWELLAFNMAEPNPIQLITHMFGHGGWAHWFWNMFYLWVFGVALEDRLGALKFWLLFLAAGAGSALIQLAFYWLAADGREVPTVRGMGASGAVFGIMGLTMARFPKAKLRFVGFAGMPYTFWVPLGWFMAWRVMGEIVMMGAGDGVGHLAHVLGCAVGLISARALHLRNAGKDEIIELQAEAHSDAGDFRGAIKYYDRLMALYPKRGLYRLKRVDCLYRSWPSSGKPSESLRKDTLDQWQRGLTLSLKEGKPAEAVEWMQQLIPPFMPEELDAGLRERLDLARKQAAAAGAAPSTLAGSPVKARFIDSDDRAAKQGRARQDLESLARQRRWPEAAEAADLLRKFQDLRDWSPAELGWGGEALRQAGANFWEDLFEQVAQRGDEDQTVRALQTLEKVWHGKIQHGKYLALLSKATERLEYLDQRPDFQDLQKRMHTVG